MASSPGDHELRFIGSDDPSVRPASIESPLITYRAASLRLPWSVMNGEDPIQGAIVLDMEREQFSRLIREWVDVRAQEEREGVGTHRRLPLRAGTATSTGAVRLSSVSSEAFGALRNTNLMVEP